MKSEVVYADPPWNYHVRNRNGCIDGAKESKYSTASLLELENITVPCSKNAIMFMWAVAPQFAECVDVMETWGFVYAGVELIWLKTLGGRPAMGVGHYTASNVEFLLVGLRGDARHVPIERRFTAERREHSAKPACVRDHVIRFCQVHNMGRPMEMFARDTSDERFDYGIGDQARVVGIGDSVELPVDVQPKRGDMNRKRRVREYILDGGRLDDSENDENKKNKKEKEKELGFSLDDKDKLGCLLIDAKHPDEVYRLNVHGAMKKDGFVLIRTSPSHVRETITAMRSVDLEYRTLMFFAYDPDNSTSNELWLACAPRGYGQGKRRGARIKNVRKRHRSQLVTTTSAFPIGRVVRASQEVFGEDVRLGVMEMESPSTFCVLCPC